MFTLSSIYWIEGYVDPSLKLDLKSGKIIPIVLLGIKL
jgi:hypothetical protein